MTREQLSKKIHWPLVIWTVGVLSIGTMMPQVIKLVMTWKADDLSLPMFVITFIVQASFSTEGFFKRSKVLVVCSGLSACITGTLIILVLVIRSTGV